MISLSIKEIITATGGELISGRDSVKITGVSIDSRRLGKSNLFVALKGLRHDGHHFVVKALSQCSSAMVEKNMRTKSAKNIILVKNSLDALGKTAALWRSKINPRVIAVSGSNGKTSVKDMLAHILKQRFRTNAAEKSFNNFLGLPLTVLNTPRMTDIMIAEMETNVIGGIRRLCEIARPDCGIITNISDSHLSDLKTRENVFREKAELAEYLSPDGTLILNNDDPFAAKFKKIFRGNLITYSLKKNSDYRARVIKTDLGGGSEFILCGKRFKTSLPGEFNALNIAAAAAAARLLAVPWKTIIKRVETFNAAQGRMNVKKIKGRILVNDTFNANPGSAGALAEVLKNEKGSKAIVFADMLELGKDARRLHTDTGAAFAKAGVESVHYTGQFGGAFIKGLKKINPAVKYAIHSDRKKLMASAASEKADIIAFKASRAMKIDEIFDHVVKHISSRNR